MTNYYFLAAILPEIRFGDPLEITFDELNLLLDENLTDEDKKKINTLRLLFDIENIRSLWWHEPINPYGKFNQVELEDAILTRIGLPVYVYAFIDQYKNVAECLHHFPELISRFFNEEIAHTHNFLREYLIFERGLRLVLASFRAKALGRDLLKELQYEDPEEPLVAQILAQKDSKTYEPPQDFEDLKGLFQEHYNDPLALHKALCEYRFAKIESMLGFDMVSSSRIVGYYIEFALAANWLMLDERQGTEIMDKILKEAT